jgi:hypothetical protein
MGIVAIGAEFARSTAAIEVLTRDLFHFVLIMGDYGLFPRSIKDHDVRWHHVVRRLPAHRTFTRLRLVPILFDALETEAMIAIGQDTESLSFLNNIVTTALTFEVT